MSRVSSQITTPSEVRVSDAISEREWEAHPCSDVADARQRSRDRTYSGFFIDLVLPGTSGVDILRGQVSHHLFSRPRVVEVIPDEQSVSRDLHGGQGNLDALPFRGRRCGPCCVRTG